MSGVLRRFVWGARAVQCVPQLSENGKKEVKIFTDHTKLFRAVNARLIAQGYYKTE